MKTAPPETSALARPQEPDRDCGLCPRLVEFRLAARAREPDWHNAPVPVFGDLSAGLLIVGLAPGLKGANRTGRPFTGDYAGDLLYATLLEFGFAAGVYAAQPGDGLRLVDCCIVNAVRCVPPQNKPTPAEIANCRPFLVRRIESMPQMQVILALGRIAHESVLRTFGAPLASAPFRHGAAHRLDRKNAAPLTLFDSYHCSRYNTNTGVLTTDMFRTVFRDIQAHLASRERRGSDALAPIT